LSKESTSGWVWEVFASVQGEGVYCGQRHTFVRFAGCNLSCDYCDTPAAQDPNPKSCRIEKAAGTSSFYDVPNPVETSTILDACRELGSESVSITGGEPLAQIVFLDALMLELKASDFTVHLETNGTLWQELRRIVDCADVVAMDIKLPSASGQEDLWESHAKFLKTASASEVFVKAIVRAETSEEEVRQCAELIGRVDRGITLVLQPVWEAAGVPGLHLMKLQDAALEMLADVRIIPQCHRFLGLR
jgi:organic radical activating enzyme